MRTVILLVATSLPFATGCTSGVPVSQLSDIQLKEASKTQREDADALTLHGTEETYYVARNAILKNDDISTVERTYDAQGNDSIVLHFTAEGTKKISDFTRTHDDTMIAVVIDGHLMLALPVRSEISESAMISGGMSQDEVARMYTMLTATEVSPAKKP